MTTTIVPAVEPGLDARAVEEICEAVCNRATDLLRADGACVTVRDGPGRLRLLVCTGVLAPLAGTTFPESRSVTGTALKSGKPYVDNDLPASDTGVHARNLPVQLTRALAVPLDSWHSVDGTLVVVNKRGDEGFDARDVELLSAFAEPTALALRGVDLVGRARAEAEREAERRRESESFVRQLSTLHEAALSVASGVELEEVLRTLVESARALTRAGHATLAILGGDGRRFQRFVMSPHGVRPVPDPTGCEGCATDGSPSPATLTHQRTKTLLRTPLVMNGRVFGNLCLMDPSEEIGFTERDEALVLMLAAQAALMIQKAELLAERAEIIEKLEASSSARLRLSAYVNHDIRNALQGAILWVERMEHMLPPRDTSGGVREASDRVASSVRHALRLVRDILDLTALEEGYLETWPRAFSVRDLLVSVTELMRPHADAREVTMLVECADELRVVADPDRVRQIVLNLVSNAVKFSAGPSTVWVAAHIAQKGPFGEDGSWCRIDVRDEGPGIPPADVERIFRPFERGEAGAKRREGTGLGLTISSGLAEHMRGVLSVEAEAGSGSTFTLWLPGDEKPEERPGWLG